MANNETPVVEDIETKYISPSPDSPNDEYLPVPGASPQKEPEAAPSPAEIKPEAPPAKKPGEEIKPEEKPAVAAPPVASEPPKDEEDVNVLAQQLKGLSTEYKRIAGESVVEYARRLEIVNLRKQLNSTRSKELLGDEPAKPATPQVGSPVAEDIDPDELADFQKKARAAGFVPVAELQASTYKTESETIFNSWIEAHPVYKDEILWGRFKQEFNSGKYNIKPKDPKILKVILDDINKDILGIHPTSELSTVRAQQEKLKVASHSASGGNSGSGKAKSDSDPELKGLVSSGALKGFTAEEIADMGLE